MSKTEIIGNLSKIALAEYGVTEYLGFRNNPRVVQYMEETGIPFSEDSIPWCAIFTNWVLKKAGIQGTGNPMARSFLKIGKPVQNPVLFDIVVYWRGSVRSWKGHVGFFMSYSEDKKTIYTLGGNQNNMVQIWPYDTDRLLGFRRVVE